MQSTPTAATREGSARIRSGKVDSPSMGDILPHPRERRTPAREQDFVPNNYKPKSRKDENSKPSTPTSSSGKRSHQGSGSEGEPDGVQHKSDAKHPHNNLGDSESEGGEAIVKPKSAWFPSDVVWAKYPGYPYWPGMVIDDRAIVGPLPRRPPNTHLVFFFAENNWSWVKETCMLPYGDSRLASAYEEFHKTKKAKAVQKLFTQAVEIANQKWMEEIGRLQKHLEANVEGAPAVKCSKCRSSINTAKQSSKAKYVCCQDCKIVVCMKCVLDVCIRPRNLNAWTCGRCYVYLWRRMKDFLEKAKAIDKRRSFWKPVDIVAVPDYTDVVREPMDFVRIGKNLSEFAYLQPKELGNDIRMICTNAMAYNGESSRYYAEAEELLKFVDEQLEPFFPPSSFSPIVYEEFRDQPSLSIPALESSLKVPEKRSASPKKEKPKPSPAVAKKPVEPPPPAPPVERTAKRKRMEVQPIVERNPSPSPPPTPTSTITPAAYRITRERMPYVVEDPSLDDLHRTKKSKTPTWTSESSNGWIRETMSGMKKLQQEVGKLKEHKDLINSLVDENGELLQEIHNKSDQISMLEDSLQAKDSELVTLRRMMLEKDKEIQELRMMYNNLRTEMMTP